MSIAQHESMQKILRHYIEEKDCEKLLELLVVHPTLKDDALALAAGWGNLEIVEAVLDKGADVNGMHMGTVSPLYLACVSMERLRLQDCWLPAGLESLASNTRIDIHHSTELLRAGIWRL